jgi:hypothetical protein
VETTWNLNELRSLILARYGKGQLGLARESLGSTIDRCEYARIHYQDAVALFDRHTQTIKESGQHLLETFFSNDDAHQQTIVRISAYITASVQSLHAIADIFAHAIYYSLGYNLLLPLTRERDVNVRFVVKHLLQRPERHDLAGGLESLVSHPDIQPRREILTFIESEYSRIERLIRETGSKLNHAVRNA